MITQARPYTQQSTATEAPALPGTWKLAAGRAITLQPREEGTFKVAHGQMWVTYDGPHRGAYNESGDHFIGAGQTVRLRAGQRMVVESWNWQNPSYFTWDPLPVAVRQTAPRFNAVLQPLADLRLAIVFGAGAVVRLVHGVGAIAWQLATGHGRAVALNATAGACSTRA
ncbi:DUF2917 domain-containing protein [Caenimonas koreensis]|nr:DUF2917 domain-containing protein [Caenimonas koreensis]